MLPNKTKRSVKVKQGFIVKNYLRFNPFFSKLKFEEEKKCFSSQCYSSVHQCHFLHGTRTTRLYLSDQVVEHFFDDEIQSIITPYLANKEKLNSKKKKSLFDVFQCFSSHCILVLDRVIALLRHNNGIATRYNSNTIQGRGGG